MAVQLFGNFIEDFPPEQDCLELRFTPSSHPIRKRWRSHRLSAHFVADYFSNFLPVDDDDPGAERRIKESKGAVSYVANELLENAMKFNHGASSYKVRFGIHFLGLGEITAVIFTTNSIDPERLDSFQAFIQELLSSDPNELFIQQVEKSAEADAETSGLGLLTMLNDYGAKLGWRFETRDSGVPCIIVTTMAQIKV